MEMTPYGDRVASWPPDVTGPRRIVNFRGGTVTRLRCHRPVAEAVRAVHGGSVRSNVYSLAASEEKELERAPSVGLITLVTTSTAQELVTELRRNAMVVEMMTTQVLRNPPSLPVYIVSADAEIAGLLADKIVAWAASSEPPPGLIGLVDAGGVRECELLLAAGFDDALAGPISPRELAGRVRAVHRRVFWKGSANGRLRYGDLTLDLYGRSLWLDGKAILLTSIELAVLRELIRARGRPLSRTELLDAAWGEGELEVSERAVDNVILRLRRKLQRPELIETVRSVGFRLAARLP